jgi:tetratricopeptide (TPR) repeat protein
VALAAFANTMPGDFVFDDVMLIKRGEELKDFKLDRIFVQNYWGFDREDKNYRPLTLLSYALNYRVTEAAWAFHAVNWMLNACVALLAYLVLRELLESAWLAALGASLFTVLPIHVEAVANLVGRAELLAGLALLGAWLVALRNSRPTDPGQQNRERPGLVITAGCITFFGLLCKENVIAVVPLLVIGNAVLRRPIPWKTLLATVIAVVLYLAVRELALHDLQHIKSSIDNPLQTAEAPTRVVNAVKLLGLYLLKIVAPLTLAADYSFNEIPVLPLKDPVLWLWALSVVAFFGLGAWVARKRAPLIVLALLFFLINIALVANVAFPVGTIFAERLAFIPSLAYPLLLCAFFKSRSLRGRGQWAWPVFAALILLYGTRTVARNADWLEAPLMQLRMSQDAPGSAKCHNITAGGYVTLASRATREKKKELLEKAEASVRKALQIAPYEKAQAKLGEILLRQGRHTEALKVLLDVLPRTTNEPLVLRYIGECYINLRQEQQALKYLDRYIETLAAMGGRRDAMGYHFRGLAKGMLERLDEALKDFNAALDMRQDIPETWINRGFCREQLRDSARQRRDISGALADYERGVEVCLEKGLLWSPDATEATASQILEEKISRLHRAVGNEATAREALEKAAEYRRKAAAEKSRP